MTRKAPSRTTRKALVLGIGALGLAATLTTAALLTQGPAATAAALRQPADDEVMAKVEPQDRAQSRALGQLAAGDVSGRVALARRWMERARRSSDPRHLGRAQAALAPWLSRAEVPQEVRLVRAQLAQSLHDFASARASGSASACARGVSSRSGRPGTSRPSSKNSRRRASFWLAAPCEMPSRRAARVMWRSDRNTSSASSRSRSSGRSRMRHHQQS